MNYVTNFIPMQVPLYVGFKPLPAGGYNAILNEACIKDNGFGTDVIKLKFKIREMEYHDRIVFIDIQLWNNNPDLVMRKNVRERAAKLLNQICTVSNYINSTNGLDLNKLLGKQMHIHLGIRVNKNKKESNTLYGVGEIKNSKPDSLEHQPVSNNDNIPFEV